tara:strand:+ start:410 stop:568 length:159 start_codon:yes stop_codon:yes gene_type:complete
MKIFFIILTILISSCAPVKEVDNFNFSEKMSFEEFVIKLSEYAEKKPYPNLD